MDSVIRLSRVGKTFGDRAIVRDVSFDVPPGRIFGLLGPSGAGKTTVVKMIAGIESPTSGVVELLGERMPKLSLQTRIGYMAQSDALYSDLTGGENLDFFASLYGLRGAAKKRRSDAVLELVGLSADRGKRVSRYSGGMKRRLSLAVALLHEPAVLLLDEPTVGIDPLLRREIWAELERIRADGTSILVTTHVMDEAEHCDTLALMRDGALIAVGTPAELKASSGASTIEEAFLAYGRAVV
ncbi:ABC transporter ATP-binding protein [Paenibacillus antri]|uniref:ABC transporter ATP-binding protein n=1 Tax=Paenibacillus antri TaxID=2582848 RepID=A0A5R9G9P2_9BACL|nr:ABC transporter ATP-binding protein [Paenibacillus antri]TLS53157.1 ABC transporter ATP-binding protein [Paenibacillus antri]